MKKISVRHHSISTQPIVAVGGVGGSGTRIIASTLQALDLNCGNFVNKAIDNLCFTFLFRDIDVFRQSDKIFASHFELFLKSLEGGHSLDLSDMKLLTDQAQRLTKGNPAKKAFADARMQGVINALQRPPTGKDIFWKEPNTHIYLPQLLSSDVKLKYIHVIRSGLDMISSKNLRQFRFWGKTLFDLPAEPSNNGILRYWASSNLRSIESLEAAKADYLLIKFEDFCQHPKHGIQKITSFLNKDISAAQVEALAACVESPASIGRHVKQDLGAIDSDNLAALKTLGYHN